MIISLPFDENKIKISAPENVTIFETCFGEANTSARQIVRHAMENPCRDISLKTKIQKRRTGQIVIVVSDITRPIPYNDFLEELLLEIQSAGITRSEIVILIATGMHRPSTKDEREHMFGHTIVENYRIEDHFAEKENELLELEKKSWAGNVIKLNKMFLQAGFRIITGLVEPHFMAGFSGGRKAVCPGLASLETLQKFHGYEFLSHPLAQNGILDGNPCHEEAISVAKIAGIDYSLNVVLNDKRQVLKAFAGDLEQAHRQACDFVVKSACPIVEQEFDLVVTSSGGYPLDATFYQCVKGLVSALPAVKKCGTIISVAGCREGIGSEAYKNLMFSNSNSWQGFLKDIKENQNVQKDQWQLQMQTRVLEKIGQANILFYTENIHQKELNSLLVNGRSVEKEKFEKEIKEIIKQYDKHGQKIAIIPEGPYCAPLYRK